MMKNLRITTYCLLLLCITIFTSCDDDGGATSSGQLTLSLSGITEPGTGYTYALWLRESADYDLLGDFTISDDGVLTQTVYSVERTRLEMADGVLISLEETDALGETPTQRFLAGDFLNKGAVLSVEHPEAMDIEFGASTASYIIDSPTDGPLTDSSSGVWFYDRTTMLSTLSLPVLDDNWIYESWLVINDSTTASMGKFSDPSLADLSNEFSGSEAGYMAPGEDFLTGDVAFPTSVFDKRLFISVEPVPDDADGAYSIRPFSQNTVDTIPASPVEMEFRELGLPRGLVTR